jgi:hypothetical protein
MAMRRSIEVEARAALETLLGQVSAVKVRDIKIESPGPHRRKDILARIDVYGRGHVLFCRVKTGDEARVVRNAMHELRSVPQRGEEEITPVLIAPQLSKEARAQCRMGRLSFLDLEGNAHLEFQEYFFDKTCVPGPEGASR